LSDEIGRVEPGGRVERQSFIPRATAFSGLTRWAIASTAPVLNLYGPHLIGKSVFARHWLDTKHGAFDFHLMDIHGWEDASVAEIITVASSRIPERKLLPSLHATESFSAWSDDLLKVWRQLNKSTILVLDEADAILIASEPRKRQWLSFLRKLAMSSSRVQLLLISREEIVYSLGDRIESAPRFFSSRLGLPAIEECRKVFVDQLAVHGFGRNANDYWHMARHLVGNHPYLIDFAIHWFRVRSGAASIDWLSFRNEVTAEVVAKRVFEELFIHLAKVPHSVPAIGMVCRLAIYAADVQGASEKPFAIRSMIERDAIDVLETFGVVAKINGGYELCSPYFAQAALQYFSAEKTLKERPDFVDQLKTITGVTNLRELGEVAELIAKGTAAALTI
jgi:hypothetical protein